MIDILLPTIRDPKFVDAVIESIRNNSDKLIAYTYKIIVIRNESKSYTDAINMGFTKGHNPFIFCGADDLRFLPGWDTAILQAFRDPKVMVVGTNDMSGRTMGDGNMFSTHSAVRRTYCEKETGTIDGSSPIMYDYEHLYADNELIEVAASRGVYFKCHEARIEHLHPAWGKRPMDEVDHAKGSNQDVYSRDGAIYNERKKQWAIHL